MRLWATRLRSSKSSSIFAMWPIWRSITSVARARMDALSGAWRSRAIE
jgi:hypothetical protein